jgi:transposase
VRRGPEPVREGSGSASPRGSRLISKACRVLAALKGRIVLHFLPPYCLDANRIERVWQDFHANVTRNHRCKTMARLLHNAREYLVRYVWRRVTGALPTIPQAA